ncbi:MAG: thiamine pyrophosphate-binding protein [Solirubrobacterales bacterium]
MKYSDQFIDWLVEEGYTHCFFVAGGNIMHLLDSVRSKMICVPFVHEVAATIAAEYFTATSDDRGKAFVLVTAGPGLTNTLTGMASAWMESRELLIVGGQVKREDLSRGEVRQRGIQEVDGATIAESVCKRVLRVEVPTDRATIVEAIRDGASPRQGPVFIEMPLDAQAAAPVPDDGAGRTVEAPVVERVPAEGLSAAIELLAKADRPVLLLGSGVQRATAHALSDELTRVGIPVMLTWNAADRVPADHPLYAGRPNTWGQRYANVLLQQSDLVLAIGTRLGLQQSGFAWDGFVPNGSIVQVDIDQTELEKGHPHVELPLRGDANAFLADLLQRASIQPAWAEWRSFVNLVKETLPLNDPANETGEGFVKPFELLMDLGDLAGERDVIIPCSSGGAFTVAMQSIQLRGQQKMLTNKAVASMGYGLSGAIGASLANPGRRTFLIEGDGGFAQNLQELGTVAVNHLPLKILLFSNDGYASIRMTQRNYFNGSWIGCDVSTGLGLPNWEVLAAAYGVPYAKMDPETGFGGVVGELLASDGPALIEVPIDPEQTYFPKIMSSVQEDGSMRSNPLHLMHPELDERTAELVFAHLNKRALNKTGN